MALLTFFSWTQILLISSSVLLSFMLYRHFAIHRPRARFFSSHGCLAPPRLHPWDPTGLYTFFAIQRWSRAHTMLERSTATLFGPDKRTTAAMTMLGFDVIATCAADNVKSLLSTQFKSFKLMQQPKEIDLLLGDGIFVSDGAAWHESRELLRPIFKREQVADLDMLEAHVGGFLKGLKAEGVGETVNVNPLAARFTLGAAVGFLFGVDSEESGLIGAKGGEFTEAWDGLVKELVEPPEGWFWIGTMMLDFMRIRPKFKQHVAKIHSLVDAFIERALSSKEAADSHRYLFLPTLASRTPPPSPTKIRAECLSVLFAGRDTTAGLLTNLFFILGQNPRAWDRLYQEISSTLGPNPNPRRAPTYDQLKNMRYLRAVINETQRLFPIVPVNLRQAREDSVLPTGGGPDGTHPIAVKADQLVVFSMFAMHRRRAVYGDDADEWRPERWLDDEKSGEKGLRVGWDFLPFSGGPRVCIGQNFAVTEVSYLLARVVQEFGRIEGRGPTEWREDFSFVCSNWGGGKVGLFPRENDETAKKEEGEKEKVDKEVGDVPTA